MTELHDVCLGCIGATLALEALLVSAWAIMAGWVVLLANTGATDYQGVVAIVVFMASLFLAVIITGLAIALAEYLDKWDD